MSEEKTGYESVTDNELVHAYERMDEELLGEELHYIELELTKRGLPIPQRV